MQDEAAVSHASKIEKSEGQLDFREGARTLHNKVCAPHYSAVQAPSVCPKCS